MNRNLSFLAIFSLLAAILVLTLRTSRSHPQEAVKEAGSSQASPGSQTTEGGPPANRQKRERPSIDRKPDDSHARIDRIKVEGTYEYNLTRSLRGEFDAGELKRLAEQPDREHEENRRLTDLILLASTEKNPDFRYLVERKDLRKEHLVDLAISAYDYAVSANPAALEHLLDAARKVPHGDSNELLILSFVDEWKLTKEALIAGGIRGDGSGGDALYGFWLKRRFLFPHSRDFPKSYDDYWNQITSGSKSTPERD